MIKKITIFSIPVILFANRCTLPISIKPYVVNESLNQLTRYSDVKRNYNALKKLCVKKISFKDGPLKWNMLLVYSQKSGPFWYLPHDNENSAFDSAIYSTLKYGGGFLSVLNNNRRYNHRQDPNRDFSYSKTRVCKEQLYPSSKYTSIVFNIIDSFKKPNMPYLALHNNTDGGSISALISTSKVKSYLANSQDPLLNDPDNLVYIAGTSKIPPKDKIEKLLQNGLNVRYEIVNRFNNDCSMSNFVVLNKGTTNYYNIEAQHGYTNTQKRMIDILINRVLR